ncbi:hypothetical protein BD779DRAFT_1626992 [Infundibulicybe gibba]|nr:hypothetical protein BD779DRAFT_1626992 [Infundibulicybe gibba]
MAGIEKPLRECEKALRDTVAQLERLVLDMSASKSFSFAENMKDVRWPFRQEEVRMVLGQIERLKSLVSLAFQTSLIEFVEKAHDELMAVGLNVARIGSAVSAIEADQRAYMVKTESFHVDLQALGWTLRDSANSITKIEHAVATIDRNQQGRALQAVLKWLAPLDFSGKHSAAFEKHAPGTGEWFLGHPKFLAWQQGEYQVLWCPGGPGVGKSVMASAVVHRLQERISDDMAVLYIYFDYTIKYTVTQLLEVLLSQLMRRREVSIMESLQSCIASNRRPTIDELIDILKVEAETFIRVFVVIDALDEIEIQIWAPLLGRLHTLSRISLLATSRDTGEIAFELRPDQRLDVMADKGDIQKYIRERLSNSTGTLKRLLDANALLHEEVVARVTENAAGMFLLTQLHMNSLEKSARITDLRRALAELPGDLKTTYDETIGRIGDEDKPLAYHIFSWLMHAARPMTIHDLQYALAVEEGMTAIDADNLYDEGYLMSICVGLVVLHDSETINIH